MTDLPTTLKRTATLINTLHQELTTQQLGTRPHSQTGVRAGTTGSKPPCNTTSLDYLLDINARLSELSCNASADLGIPIPHTVKQHGNGMWAAWLYRQHHHLENLDWYTDLDDEITDLHAELEAHLYPTGKDERPKLPDYATAEEISRAVGKKKDTIRKWCQRHKVTAFIEGGVTRYKTSEVSAP